MNTELLEALEILERENFSTFTFSVNVISVNVDAFAVVFSPICPFALFPNT